MSFEQMNTDTQVNFNQIKRFIAQCSLEEKIQLIQQLERETFPVRLERFLQQVQIEELNLADITAEVESVRQQRHEAK
jgi:hypothetical protein